MILPPLCSKKNYDGSEYLEKYCQRLVLQDSCTEAAIDKKILRCIYWSRASQPFCLTKPHSEHTTCLFYWASKHSHRPRHMLCRCKTILTRRSSLADDATSLCVANKQACQDAMCVLIGAFLCLNQLVVAPHQCYLHQAYSQTGIAFKGWPFNQSLWVRARFPFLAAKLHLHLVWDSLRMGSNSGSLTSLISRGGVSSNRQTFLEAFYLGIVFFNLWIIISGCNNYYPIIRVGYTFTHSYSWLCILPYLFHDHSSLSNHDSHLQTYHYLELGWCMISASAQTQIDAWVHAIQCWGSSAFCSQCSCQHMSQMIWLCYCCSRKQSIQLKCAWNDLLMLLLLKQSWWLDLIVCKRWVRGWQSKSFSQKSEPFWLAPLI